jgi:hypothetical protein
LIRLIGIVARWRWGEAWTGANWLRWISSYAAMALVPVAVFGLLPFDAKHR